jgi:hypothetical protein
MDVVSDVFCSQLAKSQLEIPFVIYCGRHFRLYLWFVTEFFELSNIVLPFFSVKIGHVKTEL